MYTKMAMFFSIFFCMNCHLILSDRLLPGMLLYSNNILNRFASIIHLSTTLSHKRFWVYYHHRDENTFGALLMNNLFICEPKIEDKGMFISAMQRSQSLHHPWVKAPTNPTEFDEYFQRYQQPNQKSFLVCNRCENIVGVFNVSEIVQGLFQNAYLGFYAVADFAGKGYMSAGLKLVLAKVFNELKLHRIEANIQPDNIRSIKLVKKNGFRYEGFSPRYLKIDNEWRGHERWAMTYEDFIRE